MKTNSNEVLGVFSGECLLGIVGEESSLKSWNGESLSVGDIVCTWLSDYLADHFTVVVRDGFTTYTDG